MTEKRNQRPSAAKATLRSPVDENQVRLRAYEIYVARGGEPGREVEDWVQAERELRSESLARQPEVVASRAR